MAQSTIGKPGFHSENAPVSVREGACDYTTECSSLCFRDQGLTTQGIMSK